MTAKMLNPDTPPLTDSQVDTAAGKLPPVDDNVLLLLRDLQAQINALTDRVAALEA